MDIVKDVLAHPDRPGTPEDLDKDGERPQKKRRIEKPYAEMNPAEKKDFEYEADQAVAALMIQTFHYMIENGLAYSYATTGQAFVFLHVSADDPTKLYYHLSVPNQDREDIAVEDTAIGQVLGLTLLAFKYGQPWDQSWRQAAKAQLTKYHVDTYDEDILRGVSNSGESTPAPVSEFKSKSKSAGPRDYPYRQPRRRDDSSDEEPDSSPSKRKAADTSGKYVTSLPVKSRGADLDQGRSNRKRGQQQRAFCTQQCLLGIAKGTPLDMKCPNVNAHRSPATSHQAPKSYHTITATEFPQLVTDQLAQSLDVDCEPMDIQGARGALFRITLSSHGYTFVAKGTVYAFVPDLLHEGKIYQHLEKLQGHAVPVYLGNINLVHKYYMTVGVRILHMMLLSWGGEWCGYDPVQPWNSDCDQSVRYEAWKTRRQVEAEGVEQRDFRGPNLLWNAEVNRVMLIDFERAIIPSRASNKNKKTTKPVLPKRIAQDTEEQETPDIPGGAKKVLQESSPNKKLGGRANAPKRKINLLPEGELLEKEDGADVTRRFSKRLRAQHNSNLIAQD